MNRTSDQIERDIEATRAEVDRTADALKERMEPGALFEEAVRTFRRSGGSEMFSNLTTQVKENPLPLAVMGAGMAWLMMGSGPQRRSNGYGDGYDYGATGGGNVGSGLKDKASGAVHSAKAGASGVKDRTSAIAHGAADSAHRTRDRAASAAGKARDTFHGVAEQEPFVIGALGLALGAALGAALPSTEFEDRRLGPVRDKALRKGKERLRDAKEVASSTLDSATEEAGRQDFTEEGRSFAEKAERVVQAGRDAGEDEAARRTGH